MNFRDCKNFIFFFFLDFKNSWTNHITFAEGFLQDMKHVNQEGSWHVYWWILFPAYHKIKTSWSKFGRTQQLCKALKPLVINISTQYLFFLKQMLLKILKRGANLAVIFCNVHSSFRPFYETWNIMSWWEFNVTRRVELFSSSNLLIKTYPTVFIVSEHYIFGEICPKYTRVPKYFKRR